MKDTINRLQGQLNRLENKIDNISGKLNENSQNLIQHHHDLYGNGKKGLIKRLEEVEAVQNQHSKYFWLISLICAGCGGIFTFIINKLWR